MVSPVYLLSAAHSVSLRLDLKKVTAQPEFPPPPGLPGEALPDRYEIRTDEGSPVNASHGIFPIVRYDNAGHMHLLGTGFFICTTGLFITARHVLMDTFDSKGRERYPIGLLQFIPSNTYIQRPILRCAAHPIADVAVGVAAPMNNRNGQPLTNPVVTITSVTPDLNSRVVTFAYPKHSNRIIENVQHFDVRPTFYDGDITEYFPNGRDRILLPAPCYRTSMIIHGGASGGPVFSRSGGVFGLNSTGIDGTDISFVSRIDEIFELAIDDVQMGSELPRRVPVSEIARAGHIVVKSS
jgi:hypothetical protein